MLEYTNLEAELERFFKDVIKESRKNLKAKNKLASKDLYNNMSFDVKQNKNSFEASLNMEDYAKFVDQGVKGVSSGKSLSGFKYTNKKPPLKFIRTWLKRKSGAFRSRGLNSAAFMVQNAIYQRGLKPTEFYSKPFEKEFKTLPQELIEAYALDVEDFLEFVFKD